MLQSLLIPGFLRRTDHYTLTHYPLLWVAKIHYVAFYSAVLFPGLWLLSKCLFLSTGWQLHPGAVYLFFGSVTLPFIGWWVWQQLRYPVVKYLRTPLQQVAHHCVYIICIALFLSVSYWGAWCFNQDSFEFYKTLHKVVYCMHLLIFAFPFFLILYQHIGLQKLILSVIITGMIMIFTGIGMFFTAVTIGNLLEIFSVKNPDIYLISITPFVILTAVLVYGWVLHQALKIRDFMTYPDKEYLLSRTFAIAAAQMLAFPAIVVVAGIAFYFFTVPASGIFQFEVFLTLTVIVCMIYQVFSARVFGRLYLKVKSAPR